MTATDSQDEYHFPKKELTQIYSITDLALKLAADTKANEMGFGHSTDDKYKYDPSKSIWEGWMYVAELNGDVENPKPANEEYIRVSVDGIRREDSDDFTGGIIEDLSSADMNLSCDNTPCRAEGYLTKHDRVYEGAVDGDKEYRF